MVTRYREFGTVDLVAFRIDQLSTDAGNTVATEICLTLIASVAR